MKMETSRKHFAVYTSSLGNYFFEEIRDLIASGLRQLGAKVTLVNECEEYLPDADWHIVIAPHEFFYLGMGETRRQGALPENLILVNTEQPSTQWFALSLTMFRHARAIWDIDYHSSREISKRGFNCSYLPLGFVPNFTSYERIDDLPEAIAPQALTHSARKHSYLFDPWPQRPIDILFMGTMSKKREEFFARFDGVAARYNSYLHKIPAGEPLLPGHPWYLGTSGSAGLAQRSKLVINIHRGNDVYFEWQRVVMLGIWQRTLVISEPCTSAPPFEAGKDYVEASAVEIPKLVDYYLATADGQRKAQEIIDHGYLTLTKGCLITDYLSALLNELDTISNLAADERPQPTQLGSHGAHHRTCIVVGRDEVSNSDFGAPAGMNRLGELLAGAGHGVTVLHLGIEWKKSIDKNESSVSKAGPKITHLSLPASPGVKYSHAGRHAIDSYDAYQWLKENNFDVIHFPEVGGAGYYSLLARHQGLAFENTKMVVHAYGPTSRLMQLNSRYMKDLRDLEVDFMEQQCRQLADVVATQFDEGLQTLMSAKMSLKPSEFVKPYPFPSWQNSEPKRVNRKTIKELVLITTGLNQRSVKLFCDALKKLRDSWSGHITATIISAGSPNLDEGTKSLIESCSANSVWPLKFISVEAVSTGIRYATQSSGLVFLLTPDENIHELTLHLLNAGVPVLAADLDGMSDLVPDDLRKKISIPTNPAGIAAKMREILNEGYGDVDFDSKISSIRQAWLDLDNDLARDHGTKDSSRVEPAKSRDSLPCVSICMVHHDRPKYLEQAIASVEKQDYQNFELVLVDDGSDTPGAKQYLQELEPRFAERGWQLIRQRNKYLGAARNEAARHAKGQYILFMDDDNLAKPNEVSTFVKVAIETRSDILTCVNDLFSGEDIPDMHRAKVRWLHIGGALSVGVFRNCFGDANALIKREVFERVGGFTEDYGITHEDWEFFARAVLAGYHLEPVVEPLFWYRANEGSMIKSTDEFANNMRHLRPYLDAVPFDLRGLVHFGLGLNMRDWEVDSRIKTDEVDALVVASRALFDMQLYESGVLALYGALLGARKNDRKSAVKEIMDILQKPNFKKILSKNKISLKSIGMQSGDDADKKLGALSTENSETEISKATERMTSIIILTYNGLPMTRACIDSIRRNTDVPHEIVIVDNASNDGTVVFLQRLAKQDKNVKILLNRENKGFPAGCNQGIQASKGEYVVLLNNDVTVTKGWLSGLIECAERDGSFGMIGPMTNKISGFQREPNADYKDLRGLRNFAAAYHQKNRGKWQLSNRLAGFCLLIKKEVIDEIGGFDTAFGVGNCEDDDYALRASLRGYNSVIAQDIFVDHRGGGSFLVEGVSKYRSLLHRNEEIFSAKWGITPENWWRDRISPTKHAPLYVPLDAERKDDARCTQDRSAHESVDKPTVSKPEDIVKISRSTAAQSVKEIVEMAQKRYLEGEIRAAVELAAKALMQERSNGEATNLMGLIAFKTGQHASATEFFRTAASHPSIRESATFNMTVTRARELLQSSKYQESVDLIGSLELTNLRQPDRIACDIPHALLGFGKLGLGDLEGAKASFERALALNNSSSQACLGLGEIFRLSGMNDHAKTMYEWAVRNDPSNVVARENLNKVIAVLGQSGNNEPGSTKIEGDLISVEQLQEDKKSKLR